MSKLVSSVVVCLLILSLILPHTSEACQLALHATTTSGTVSRTTPTPPATETIALVSTRTVVLTPAVTPAVAGSAAVKVDTLNLRAGPGTEYHTQGKLTRGARVQVVGEVGGCAWLQVVTPAGQQGWIAGNQRYIALDTACSAVPDGHYRPLTGIIRSHVKKPGLGKLQIQNKSVDGVAILTDLKDAPVMAAYVRGADEDNKQKGEAVTLTGIPDGVYRLYFAHGKQWNGNEKKFEESVERQRFEDIFKFETKGGMYTVWEVTLFPVTGGNATSEQVGESDFPVLD
jgi:uncharacterized protein YraI